MALAAKNYDHKKFNATERLDALLGFNFQIMTEYFVSTSTNNLPPSLIR